MGSNFNEEFEFVESNISLESQNHGSYRNYECQKQLYAQEQIPADWDFSSLSQQPIQSRDSLQESNTGASLSSQPSQSFRQSISSEYETHTTDLLDFSNSQFNNTNLHLHQSNDNEENTHPLMSCRDASYFLNQVFHDKENIFDERIHHDLKMQRCIDLNYSSIFDEMEDEQSSIFEPQYTDQDLIMLHQNLDEQDLQMNKINTRPIDVFHNNLEDEDVVMQDPSSSTSSSTMCTSCTTTTLSESTNTTNTSSVLSFFSSSQYSIFCPESESYITTPIYEWPNDETTLSSSTDALGLLHKMKVNISELNPLKISEAVRKTIREEFIIQDLFLKGENLQPPEIPKSIRKKSDRDVEWTPLSVYKAYTNIKSPTNSKEAYNRLVPYSSCIGTLNYRPKDHAAWKRSPNRRR